MLKDEFYGWAIGQLIASGISVKLLNKRVHQGCGGFFSCTNKELVVCTKSKDEFHTFVHEYCHFLQWRDFPKIWDKYITKCDSFFCWLAGENLNTETALDAMAGAQLLERDCESRALSLIKKLKLPIDIDTYTQQANAYLYSYLISHKLRKWPNTKISVYSPELLKFFPKKLVTKNKLHDIYALPKETLNTLTSQCYKIK